MRKKSLAFIGILLAATVAVSAQSGAVKEAANRESSATAENNAQKGTVKGKITTSDNKPAEGVTVMVKGTAKGTLTDENGVYEISNLGVGNHTLSVSHTGLETMESQVQVTAGQIASLDISLKETSNALDEVVVEGKRSQTFF